MQLKVLLVLPQLLLLQLGRLLTLHLLNLLLPAPPLLRPLMMPLLLRVLLLMVTRLLQLVLQLQPSTNLTLQLLLHGLPNMTTQQLPQHLLLFQLLRLLLQAHLMLLRPRFQMLPALLLQVLLHHPLPHQVPQLPAQPQAMPL